MTDILSNIAKNIGAENKVGHAPVNLWSPDFCGEIDLEIKPNGEWHYMGSAIKRQKLVKLFATVLWRDVAGDGSHYLVTPVEKIKIKVTDAAFIASQIWAEGEGDEQTLAIETNLAGRLVIGADHPIRFVNDDKQFMAYVQVRFGLEAKLTRSACFQLADYLTEINGKHVLISDNQHFTV